MSSTAAEVIGVHFDPNGHPVDGPVRDGHHVSTENPEAEPFLPHIGKVLGRASSVCPASFLGCVCFDPEEGISTDLQVLGNGARKADETHIAAVGELFASQLSVPLQCAKLESPWTVQVDCHNAVADAP